LAAIDDSIHNGDRQADITFDSASAVDTMYNGLVIAPVTVFIKDDDVQGIAVVESGGVTTASEASCATPDSFTVVLKSAPTSLVSFAVSPDIQVTTDKATLIFDATNWSTPQTVYVCAVDDGMVEGSPHIGHVRLSVTSSDIDYSNYKVPDVLVQIADNDTAGFDLTGNQSMTVYEGGKGAEFTIQLHAQPSSNVVIQMVPENGQVSVSPTSITFTPADWNRPHTVLVGAVDDKIVEADKYSYIKFAAVSNDPYFNHLAIADIHPYVIDNDSLVIVREPTAGTDITRDGRSDVYTMVLFTRPKYKVTITIKPPKKVVASKKIVTFTPKNWNIPQTIIVSWKDGASGSGKGQTVTIKHTAKSRDKRFNKLKIRSITVHITDHYNPQAANRARIGAGFGGNIGSAFSAPLAIDPNSTAGTSSGGSTTTTTTTNATTGTTTTTTTAGG